MQKYRTLWFCLQQQRQFDGEDYPFPYVTAPQEVKEGRLIPVSALWSSYYFHPHFPEEDTEAQRG